MLLLIGSEAAHRRMTGVRTDTDIDLIMTMGDLLDFVEENGVDAAPISKTKFVGKWCGALIEMEVAWPDSTAEWLLDQITGDVIDLMGQKLFLPDLDWLYTIKMSHRFLADSPHFLKTMRDIRDMRSAGAKIADEVWLEARELETYTKLRPKLNVSKDTFFAEGRERFPYDHDQLHELVKVLHKPAYEYYKGDGKEVWSDKEKWNACNEYVKQAGVLEECYVLALERCLIPHPGKVTPAVAFRMALEKVCTSITSGYFREYAWENFNSIVARSNDFYHDRFLRAVKDGTLRRASPIVHGPAPLL